MHSGEQVLSLHVYRVGGFLGDDKIIKAQDKITNLYYQKVCRRDTHWAFSLHSVGPSGTLVCKASSGYTGPPLISDLSPGPIMVDIASERQPVYIVSQHGTFGGIQYFRGPDDREYFWRSSARLWRTHIQCLDMRGEIMATYRPTTMAFSKDGELCIYPSGQFMIDLLVATSLAIRMPNH